MEVSGLHATEGSVKHDDVEAVSRGRGQPMRVDVAGQDGPVEYPDNWVELTIRAE